MFSIIRAPRKESPLIIRMNKTKNSPNASFEDIRAVSPPEPLEKGGNCEAAPILGVHPQSLFVTYLTFVLNDNPADLVDSTLTTFHCCKDIEDLIAPACDAEHIIALHTDGALPVASQVEDVKARMWRHFALVAFPVSCKMGITSYWAEKTHEYEPKFEASH